MENQKESFRSWAILELFGHQQLAGEVSDFTLGGESFVRVDVPETEKQPAFTKMYGGKAIYSISPVSEAVARATAERIDMKPITTYAPELLSKTDAAHLKYIKDTHPDVWKEASQGKLLGTKTEKEPWEKGFEEDDE